MRSLFLGKMLLNFSIIFYVVRQKEKLLRRVKTVGSVFPSQTGSLFCVEKLFLERNSLEAARKFRFYDNVKSGEGTGGRGGKAWSD